MNVLFKMDAKAKQDPCINNKLQEKVMEEQNEGVSCSKSRHKLSNSQDKPGTKLVGFKPELKKKY